MDIDRLYVLAIAVVAAAAGPTQSPTPAPAGTGGEPAASVAAPASTTASPTATGLSGRWRFNAAQSDDARQKMRDAQGQRGGFGGGGGGGRWGGRGGGGGGGGFGGGGFGGRRGGGRMGGGDGERPDSDSRENMRSVFEPPQEMTVTQTETEIAVMEKDGRLRTLHPDGKKYKSDSSKTEVKTWWDKGRLMVESKPDRGPKLTETFALAADRSRLDVSVLIEGRYGDPVTVHRVYDAAAAE
jgi:hypothetical protein